MGDGTPVRAATAGEDVGADPELAARNAAMEVLNARHPTQDYVIGFDKDGWHAWSTVVRTRSDRPDLDAASAKELDGLLDAVLELPGWLAAHPGAEVKEHGGDWEGSYPFSGLGARLWTGPVPRSELTAAMRLLAERAAACGRIEREFPRWLAGVSPDGTWLAVHPDGQKVKAPDEKGLRERLRAATGGHA